MCANISNLLYCCAQAIKQQKENHMRDPIIYKVLRQSEWGALSRDGHFEGSAHDQRDGFIHMSTAAQLQGTLDKHYTQGDILVLAAVRYKDVAETVKWEVSRGGAEFPHIYGVLPLKAVEQHYDLSPSPKERYAIPDFIEN